VQGTEHLGCSLGSRPSWRSLKLLDFGRSSQFCKAGIFWRFWVRNIRAIIFHWLFGMFVTLFLYSSIILNSKCFQMKNPCKSKGCRISSGIIGTLLFLLGLVLVIFFDMIYKTVIKNVSSALLWESLIIDYCNNDFSAGFQRQFQQGMTWHLCRTKLQGFAAFRMDLRRILAWQMFA